MVEIATGNFSDAAPGAADSAAGSLAGPAQVANGSSPIAEQGVYEGRWCVSGVVAALAESVAGVLPPVKITVTPRCTRSAASAGNRSYCPSAQRYSIETLWPST
jgi:hypothetical protein